MQIIQIDKMKTVTSGKYTLKRNKVFIKKLIFPKVIRNGKPQPSHFVETMKDKCSENHAHTHNSNTFEN